MSAPVEEYFYFILLQIKTERIIIMKKTLKSGITLLLALLMVVSFTACGKLAKTGNLQNDTSYMQGAGSGDSQASGQIKGGLWENATYTQDKEFGNGKKEIKVEVKADDQSVTFTVKTDKKTVGEALLEHGLISGDQGEYGLYVKVVNGITADYDVDQSFWSFCKDGEMMMVGVDGANISDGEHYELVYTK